MTRFLSEKELCSVVRRLSSKSEDVFWVASPYLGLGAYQVFSHRIVDAPPEDVRFIFGLNEGAVRGGGVNPYEIENFQNLFNNRNIRTNNTFHAKLYIFDKKALVTSANLSQTAFERNVEVGALFEGDQVEKIKRFYEKLWNDSYPIGNLDKYKKIWHKARPTKKWDKSSGIYRKGKKRHTKIEPWDEQFMGWIISVHEIMKPETANKVRRATGWKRNWIAGIDWKIFVRMKPGHIVFVVDMLSQRRTLSMVRVKDKRPIETGEGNYHFYYRPEKDAKVGIDKTMNELIRLDLATSRGLKSYYRQKLTYPQLARLMRITKA